jgi:hypothetical protein
MQHLHILGVRIVAREGEVELAVERNNFGAERAQELGRERPGGAIPTSRDDLEMAFQFWPAGQIGDVTGRKVGHEFISASHLGAVIAGDDDVAQARHLLRPEGHRPCRALPSRPRTGHTPR